VGLEDLAAADSPAANSPVHRLHPLAKLITTVVYVVTVVSFSGRNVSGLAAFLLYPAVLLPLSGLPLRPLLIRLLPALPFSLLGAMGNLAVLRESAFFWGPLNVTVGMVSFVSILLKTMLTVFALLILMACTPFPQLLSRMRALGLPRLICFQLALTFRYLSVLWVEAAAMAAAYTLRGGGRGIAVKDAGFFLGQLILRSFDRAGRIYQAMRCRGFKEGIFACETRPFRPSDGLYTLLLSGAFIGLRCFNLSRFLGSLAGGMAARFAARIFS
jgi:cobalt/nickel transport system permease protein